MGLTSKGASPKVGIVGGTGRMGSWFAGILEQLGLTVFRVGRKTKLTPTEIARECEVVVISVPIVDTVKVIQEIGPLMAKNALLMDLTSIKKRPVEAMLTFSRAEVVGTHPLFGPHGALGPELKIAVCPGRGEIRLHWLLRIFFEAGLKVTILSPEEHDYLMGLVQGVNHFSTLALALCISRSGLRHEDLLDCTTQTFRDRLDRVSAILEEPAELFGSLLMDNPPAMELMGQYLNAAEDLFRITRRKDREAFGSLFEELKGFFNP